ncbi:hypothetical protein [Providencia phage PSTCR7]|uniref:Uncharacterized protein n=1 Tax=Providencia phage PSTCR7 TaxID=2783549 RepID=A0A7S9SW57_9CAUD|nr:hypothetical protein PQD10_gp84 [Providencia phage PSTCR7]QPI18536.1 hypothetical protein [Providencia phage PSTCR7]
MSDYGVVFSDARGVNVDTYLKKYVIDVVKAKSGTSKRYPNAPDLEAVMYSALGVYSGSATVSGDTVSWPSSTQLGTPWTDNDVIIVTAGRGVVASNDYDSVIVDSGGKPLFPYSPSTYVFYKRLQLPVGHGKTLNIGITTSEPTPLVFFGGDTFTVKDVSPGNWNSDNTAIGAMFRTDISGNQHRIFCHFESGVVFAYIFMPSSYVWAKTASADRPDYGAVSFNDRGEIQFISGQTPLEFIKTSTENMTAPKEMGFKCAFLGTITGHFPVISGLGGFYRVSVSNVGKGTQHQPCTITTGMSQSPVNGRYPYTYCTNRTRYE